MTFLSLHLFQIYANIQKSTQPNSISYNLQRSNRWQPLLTSRNQSMIVQNLDISIQPQSINYGSIRNDWAKFIEVKVETHLREQFMAWRRHQTGSYTQFNRFCMQIVKPLLPELEKHTVLSVDGNRSYWNKLAELEERIQQNLKQIFDVHEVRVSSHKWIFLSKFHLSSFFYCFEKFLFP